MDAELRCTCGTVRAVARDVSSRTVNRVTCYCDDCQAWAHYLGRADLLDAKGGTDIVQVAPSRFAFEAGADRVAGVRLGPKGLHRYYAACCKTPVGNTFSPGVPFVGIPVGVFGGDPDTLFGPSRGAILGKFAVGGPPKGSTGLNPGLLLPVVKMVAGWRLGGKGWPHPFFDRATGRSTRQMEILSPSARDALRPLCGPSPAAR